MKKLIMAFFVISALTLTLAACSGSTPPNGSGSSSANTVHMNDNNFVQSSVTIKKGESLTIIDDTAATHILQNGSWDNGTAKPTKESGAPMVNATFNGNDTQTVGPFTTAGTFHIYCTIHPDMNLTVTVQ